MPSYYWKCFVRIVYFLRNVPDGRRMSTLEIPNKKAIEEVQKNK
jgi:hypothetical protein